MKKYRYVICLLTEDCYGDFIEAKGDQVHGCPVCADFTCASAFDDTEQAHAFAYDCGYKAGDYAIHGYYF